MRCFVIIVMLVAFFELCVTGQAKKETVAPPNKAATDSQQGTSERQRLDEEKLRQEIKKLELENQKLGGWRDIVSTNAGFITAIVAVVGVIITVWRQMDENKSRRKQFEMARQQDLDLRDREKKQRLEAIAEERKRRTEASLASAVQQLGSKDRQAQASAALSIISFVRPESEDQAYLILLSALRLKQSDQTHGILISGFEKVLRNLVHRQTALDANRADRPDWNFSRANLSRVNLPKLSLWSGPRF